MSKEALQFLLVSPLFRIFKRLTEIERRVNNMATQEEVDQLAASLQFVSAQLAKGFSEVQGEISNLKAQVVAGQSVDLSGLEAQVASLASQAQALDDVVPDEITSSTPEGEPAPADEEE